LQLCVLSGLVGFLTDADRRVRKDTWKSIHHLGDQSADELYQLQPASLYETTNLRLDNLARAQSMRDELWQWLFRSKVYLPLVEM
jgi:oligoendopeptidase F